MFKDNMKTIGDIFQEASDNFELIEKIFYLKQNVDETPIKKFEDSKFAKKLGMGIKNSIAKKF